MLADKSGGALAMKEAVVIYTRAAIEAIPITCFRSVIDYFCVRKFRMRLEGFFDICGSGEGNGDLKGSI